MSEKYWRLVAAVSLSALCGLTLRVHAQEGLRDRDPHLAVTKKISSELQQAGLHWGPFFLISRLQLADIGYDPHFYIPTDTPRGFRYAISAPQRLYFVPTRKIVASAEFSPSVAFVVNKGIRTQFGYTTRGDLQFIFNRVWLDVHLGFLNDLRAKTGEVNSVVTAKETSYGVNGEFKYSSRTTSTFSSVLRRTAYPSKRLQPEKVIDLLPLLDRRETDFRIAVKHATFPLTTLTLAAEASNYTFDKQSALDSNRRYVALGANFEKGVTIARLEVGRGQLNFRSPAQRDFSGILGSFTFNRRLGARMLFSANVVRDIDFSLVRDNGYYLGERFGASLDYDATRRLRLRAMSQYGRDSYESLIPGVPATLRRDTISFNGVGWNYSRRHIQGGFDVGYYERRSSLPSEFSDNSKGIRWLYHLSLTL